MKRPLRPPSTLPSSLASCRRAATTIEYGLILAFIFLAMVGAVTGLGATASAMWNDIATKVQRTR